MYYTLKPTIPDFECTDGPFAGRKFASGYRYAQVPPEEEAKFEAIPEEPDAAPGPAAPSRLSPAAQPLDQAPGDEAGAPTTSPEEES